MITVTAADPVHSVTCMKISSHVTDFVTSIVLRGCCFGLSACQSNRASSTMMFRIFLGFSVKLEDVLQVYFWSAALVDFVTAMKR